VPCQAPMAAGRAAFARFGSPATNLFLLGLYLWQVCLYPASTGVCAYAGATQRGASVVVCAASHPSIPEDEQPRQPPQLPNQPLSSGSMQVGNERFEAARQNLKPWLTLHPYLPLFAGFPCTILVAGAKAELLGPRALGFRRRCFSPSTCQSAS
jgi:hypothetical protein